jgi:hypothetical protein
MSDVTRLLDAAAAGEPHAAAELLPLVYAELRPGEHTAAARSAEEGDGKRFLTPFSLQTCSERTVGGK